MDIRQQIWEARNSHYTKKMHDATIVIMTPKDYAELVKELQGLDTTGCDVKNGQLTSIFGLHPFRSFDIEQGKFLIR